MKRTGSIVALAIILTTGAWGQKLTVSVMDLNVTEGLSAKEVVMLTDKLLNELVSQGTYKVIERSKRDEVLKEQGSQQTGACDASSCLVEAGQYLGAQKMFGGTIGRFGAVYAVELRMIDVKTGEIDMAFSKKYTGDVSNLLDAMKEAAAEFSKWKPGPQVTSTRLKVEYGSVKVISKPSGARIMVDGTLVGETPAKLDRIELGECRIRLEKDGYQPYEATATVGLGVPTSVNATLARAALPAVAKTASTSSSTDNATSKGKGKALPGQELVNEKDGSVLVEVPDGTFGMGSNNGNRDEGPVHIVYLDRFYIGKYEVSVGQYRKFCNATGHLFPEQPDWNGNNDHPIVNVTWNDAKAYCDWAGLRLPTEAEWEKAARGNEGRKYPWGNDWETSRCNIYESVDGYSRTAPIGSYPNGVSPYGCHEMAGNVWEWCNDWYDEKYYSSSPKANPRGATVGASKVLRGGSWAMDAGVCRSTGRCAYSPDSLGTSIGFRVAR